MILIKLAWRNLYRHLRKTLLLGTLITVGIAVLFVANAVFDGTNDGLERTFRGSFTGDAVLGEQSETAYSLFGNEVPIVSEYETVPPLHSHGEITESLGDLAGLEASTSIVSAPAQININGYRQNVPLFGVDPDTYFDVCVDVEILTGDVNGLADEGVFINSVLAADAEKALGRSLEPGEPVSFSMYIGNSFRVRTVPFLGVHKYAGSTEALDRVVFADLVTVRSLANYTLGYSTTSEEESSVEEDLFSMDDLFAENTDVESNAESGVDLTELETILADTGDRDALVLTDDGAWSFILLKAEEGRSATMIRNLKRILRENDLDAKFLSWRNAAGSTALILFAVQSLFYVGLGFLGLGAVLVIMNALVISVLERTNEIGTMRSIGASAGFIRGLFIAESMIITVSAAVIGIILGIMITAAMNRTGITLDNPLLISLFGGAVLSPHVSLNGILLHLGVAFGLGALAWIYPVSIAIKIQPLAAMNKV